MVDLQKTLTTYAYNITGSMEDARDVVQDVMEKYIGMDGSHIENERNYLIKSTVNRAINLKKRKTYESRYGSWLPEPLELHRADSPIIQEQTASYTLLVLMERLNALERAVFILKEGFDYRHREIAEVLDIRTDHSRQVYLRARKSLKRPVSKGTGTTSQVMDEYIRAIIQGDVRRLESLLLEDVELMVDGGKNVKIVSGGSMGPRDTARLLQKVYRLFLKDDSHSVTLLNHHPALVFHRDGVVHNCHILVIDRDGIAAVYSIVDPEKLKDIKIS